MSCVARNYLRRDCSGIAMLVTRRGAASVCRHLVRSFSATSVKLQQQEQLGEWDFVWYTLVSWMMYMCVHATASTSSSGSVTDSQHGFRPLYLDNAATTPMVSCSGVWERIIWPSWTCAYRTLESWMSCCHTCQPTMATPTLVHMRMAGKAKKQWRLQERCAVEWPQSRCEIPYFFPANS